MKTRFIIKTVKPVAIAEPKPAKKEPRNYKVISFQNQTSPFNIYTLEDDGNYHGKSGCSIPFHSCFDRYKIYSVKRLNDNVVFTIGDTVIVSGKTHSIHYLKHAHNSFINQDIAFAEFADTIGGTNIRDFEHAIKSVVVFPPAKKKVNALFIGRK